MEAVFERMMHELWLYGLDPERVVVKLHTDDYRTVQGALQVELKQKDGVAINRLETTFGTVVLEDAGEKL